jgi:hypothetical protein
MCKPWVSFEREIWFGMLAFVDVSACDYVGQVAISVSRIGCLVYLCAGDWSQPWSMARTGTMLREEQRSGTVKRPCDKVGLPSWSLMVNLGRRQIGTRLRGSYGPERSTKPCDKVEINVTHGGRIPCREDFATGYTRSSVQVPGSRRKWRIEEELQYFEVL